MRGDAVLVPLHQQWVMVRESRAVGEAGDAPAAPPPGPAAAAPPPAAGAAPHRLAQMVALRVRHERLLRALTVDQLAAAAGVGAADLAEIERGGQGRDGRVAFAEVRRLERTLRVALLPPGC